MKPFGIISDTHNHAFSAFADIDASGINTRLLATLAQTTRAAAAVKAAGGDTLYHGGDLFHVRGSIAPSVLNPTKDCYKAIIDSGVRVIINAGNHDLEGRHAARLSSAITALEDIGCVIVNHPNRHDDMVIIPWIANLNELRTTLEEWAGSVTDARELDLLIHAPVDGVIAGLPDHGLDPSWLENLGFRRVFSGHYHHHKDVADNVWSIGALTHQTWSDVRAKAGFLIVDGDDRDNVHWHASSAPSFVEIDADTDIASIADIVDGNFVRMKIDSSKASDIKAVRQHLLDCGAAGVMMLPMASAPVVARSGTSIKAGASLEASIADFIALQAYSDSAALGALCQDILTAVRNAT